MKISTAIVATAFYLALGVILVNFTGQCDVALEGIVFSVVEQRMNEKKRNRSCSHSFLHFHDCFVKGCDASILLDGDSSEKNATANRSVGGYDVIDEANELFEEACEGVVSCADIIALAAKDVVQLSGGGRYEVQTRRRDEIESLASNVNLPSPSFLVRQSVDTFKKKGI
ncbi:hypothetical protein like AT4G26010 [Hibiscus trionum]|uniref:peroxidase n=1 Tax=Hibiscus trionum TaxID=183268 RepID=A0A9W7ITC2_HIBTR|nr:hypothetical protein like AT4G26010 [Hibiscus trionum]